MERNGDEVVKDSAEVEKNSAEVAAEIISEIVYSAYSEFGNRKFPKSTILHLFSRKFSTKTG